MISTVFDNKTLLITGGTGSFGVAVLDMFLNTNIKQIRILSRDELKQDNMRKQYSDERVKFYIGDVRDRNTLDEATYGSDCIVHAAALKQVPSCEFHPIEAVHTNTIGACNVFDAAISNGVKRVVILSTDKAVYPINAMGISKAMMEKIMVAKSRSATTRGCVLCCVRYGNVLATRGSMVPLFVEQIARNIPITITRPDMTRFMMTMNEAIELVLSAVSCASPGDIFVKKAPAATIGTVVDALKSILNKNDHTVVSIGTRHGEKIHETLMTSYEHARSSEICTHYVIPADNRDLNYSLYTTSGYNDDKSNDYTSDKAVRLTVVQTKQILNGLAVVQDSIKKFNGK